MRGELIARSRDHRLRSGLPPLAAAQRRQRRDAARVGRARVAVRAHRPGGDALPTGASHPAAQQVPPPVVGLHGGWAAKPLPPFSPESPGRTLAFAQPGALWLRSERLAPLRGRGEETSRGPSATLPRACSDPSCRPRRGNSLRTAPCGRPSISPYLPMSPHISPYLPVSADRVAGPLAPAENISPYLPISPAEDICPPHAPHASVRRGRRGGCTTARRETSRGRGAPSPPAAASSRRTLHPLPRAGLGRRA